jgi:hypothetical protein
MRRLDIRVEAPWAAAVGGRRLSRGRPCAAPTADFLPPLSPVGDSARRMRPRLPRLPGRPDQPPRARPPGRRPPAGRRQVAPTPRPCSSTCAPRPPGCSGVRAYERRGSRQGGEGGGGHHGGLPEEGAIRPSERAERRVRFPGEQVRTLVRTRCACRCEARPHPASKAANRRWKSGAGEGT